jgi:hypothetical protein
MSKRTLTASQAAKALGISKEYLNGQVRDKGAPCDTHENGRRLFSEAELREWFNNVGSVQPRLANKTGVFSQAERDKAEIVAGDGDDAAMPMAEALRRRTIEEARDRKMKNDIREGKLMDAVEVERAWAQESMTIRMAIEAIPVKAAQQVVAALQLPAERIQTIRSLLDHEVREAMRGLSA